MPIKWVAEDKPLRESAGVNLLIRNARDRIEQLNNESDHCFDVEKLLEINREISRLTGMIAEWKEKLSHAD